MGRGATATLERLAGIDLPNEQNHRRMDPATWKDDLAAGLVDALLDQQATVRRRDKEAEAARRQRRITRRTGAAVGLLLIAIAMTVWGYTLPEPRTDLLFLLLLFLVGPTAGAGGALAFSAWRGEDDRQSLGTIAGLGFVAGLVSSLVYLLAQFTTAPDAKTIKGLAIFVAMVTGLLAGFAVDRVFKQAVEGRTPGLPGGAERPSRRPDRGLNP